MRHTEYLHLIDRGRKAGLGTAELYRALASHLPAAGGRPFGQTDGNGFAAGYYQGRREYIPVGRPGRS